MWHVVLKDGTMFTGKRTWRAIWREAFFERAYKVTDSATLPVGSIVQVPLGSMLYRMKVEKEK